MDTFTPISPPDYSDNAITETPRVRSVSFGDGYKQNAPDGLNANDATATFTWSNVSDTEKAYLLNFYRSHIGATFYWNAPGDIIGSGKWRFTGQIKHAAAGYNNWTISFQFERSFELA